MISEGFRAHVAARVNVRYRIKWVDENTKNRGIMNNAWSKLLWNYWQDLASIDHACLAVKCLNHDITIPIQVYPLFNFGCEGKTWVDLPGCRTCKVQFVACAQESHGLETCAEPVAMFKLVSSSWWSTSTGLVQSSSSLIAKNWGHGFDMTSL